MSFCYTPAVSLAIKFQCYYLFDMMIMWPCINLNVSRAEYNFGNVNKPINLIRIVLSQCFKVKSYN